MFPAQRMIKLKGKGKANYLDLIITYWYTSDLHTISQKLNLSSVKTFQRVSKMSQQVK